jgi:hypothetical protein
MKILLITDIRPENENLLVHPAGANEEIAPGCPW